MVEFEGDFYDPERIESVTVHQSARHTWFNSEEWTLTVNLQSSEGFCYPFNSQEQAFRFRDKLIAKIREASAAKAAEDERRGWKSVGDQS